MLRSLAASSLVCLVAIATPAAAETGAPWPWLGISFPGSNHEPIRVTEVYPATGAARAGVLVDDEIVAIDGHALRSGDDLRSRVRSHTAGDRITVTVVRGGHELTLEALLGPQPSASELLELRLLGAPLPPMRVVDRHAGPRPRAVYDGWRHDTQLPPLPAYDPRAHSGHDGRPAMLVVFDATCEPCGSAAAALIQDVADAGSSIAVRTVVVGAADEVASYLARVPITGTVGRWDPGEGPRGTAVLSGLVGPRGEGAILVVDHAGVVQFAACTTDLAEVRAGALAAAARVQQRFRRRGRPLHDPGEPAR